MFPTDKGTGVSPYVARIISRLDELGTPYQLTSMGTILETVTVEDALNILRLAYDTLANDCERIYVTARMDIRKGDMGRMKQKIRSVKNRLGKRDSKTVNDH